MIFFKEKKKKEGRKSSGFYVFIMEANNYELTSEISFALTTKFLKTINRKLATYVYRGESL